MLIIIGLVLIAAIVLGIFIYRKVKARIAVEREAQRVKDEQDISNAISGVGSLFKQKNDFLNLSLLFNNHFFAYSEMESFKNDIKDLMLLIEDLKKHKALNRLENLEEVQAFYDKAIHIEQIRNAHNTEFIQKELTLNKEFFDTVLKYPLDPQQRESIVKLEDNVLVISSAGSGKTSTMIGKLLYLVNVRDIPPSRILTITYTHKAADELTQRLLGTGLTCITFHKLAMNVISKVDKKVPSIASDDLFVDVFNRQLKSTTFRNGILNYLTDYKSLMKNEHDYDDSVEYYADRRKYGVTALYADMDGFMITTKSEEEKKICSYLTELGVSFKYEQPYEHPTYTDEFRQYKPDFTIYYKDKEGKLQHVYLEHFGINASGQVPKWFGNNTSGGWFEANQNYKEGMEWKISTHKQYGTKLIYTTSADFHNGTIRQRLKDLLDSVGVPTHELTADQLLQKIFSRNKSVENALLQMTQSFINLVKANQKSIDDVYEDARRNGSHRDMFVIDKIMRPIWDSYQEELKKRDEMDFTDVITLATKYCNEGKWTQKYEYILVDEFQDISIDRYKLLQSLRTDLPKTKLYCVGDDWQSIYRFTGSDMTLFSEFSKYFGYTEECKIETTYRFGNPLINESSKFIQKNPLQKEKKIHPRKVKQNEAKPVTKLSFMHYKNNAELGSLMDRMIARVPKDKSAYIISRYSYDVKALVSANRNMQYNADDDSVIITFGDRKVKFMTIHGSKGLEADYVFLLNCNSGLYGFPSLVSDDPVLDYVLSEPEHYEYAEERRVFYVGITRAKVHTVVLYNEESPSPFVCEMDQKVVENPDPCPLCGTGHRIVKFEGFAKNKTYYKVWGCDNKEANCQYFEREFMNRTTKRRRNY